MKGMGVDAYTMVQSLTGVVLPDCKMMKSCSREMLAVIEEGVWLVARFAQWRWWLVPIPGQRLSAAYQIQYERHTFAGLLSQLDSVRNTEKDPPSRY